MNNVCRLACSTLLICFATFIIAGCAKTPPKTEPAMPPTAEEKNIPKKIIVAKVNDSVLTMDELVTMMNNIPDLASPASETVEERKKRALDSLVLMELAYQRATALGLNPDPNSIQTGVDAFKLKLGGNEQYAEYLDRHNLTNADVLVEELRIVLVRVPLALPILDYPQTEANRMDFMTH